jgi:TPR repeat protein
MEAHPQISRAIAKGLMALLIAGVGRADAQQSAPPPEVLLGQAAQHELEGEWAPAFEAWLRVLEQAPSSAEAAEARRSANQLVARLEDDPPAYPFPELDTLRPTLSALAQRQVHGAAMLLGRLLREMGEPAAAFDVYRTAAVQGHPPAMIQVGLMYSNGDGIAQDMERASYWLRPANVKGDPLGKYLLAECFLYGKGVAENQALAVTLLEQAVEMERPARAMDLLGTCYHKGLGVEPDSREAARWYQSACDLGFDQACANLAVLVMRGDGAPPDPARAVSLLRPGADRRHPASMFLFGLALLEGAGVDRDPKAGQQWIAEAAGAGHAKARAWCAAHAIDPAPPRLTP